jgi:hypothetical protein
MAANMKATETISIRGELRRPTIITNNHIRNGQLSIIVPEALRKDLRKLVLTIIAQNAKNVEKQKDNKHNKTANPIELNDDITITAKLFLPNSSKPTSSPIFSFKKLKDVDKLNMLIT